MTTPPAPPTDETDLRDQYRQLVERMGNQVCDQEPAVYAAILRELSQHYVNPRPGWFKRLHAECLRRCAIAAGVPPTFEDWAHSRP